MPTKQTSMLCRMSDVDILGSCADILAALEEKAEEQPGAVWPLLRGMRRVPGVPRHAQLAICAFALKQWRQAAIQAKKENPGSGTSAPGRDQHPTQKGHADASDTTQTD